MPPADRDSCSDLTWVLWLLIIGLISLVVALCAGILKSATGAGVAEAVMTGGTAFATSAGLCLVALATVLALKGSR